MSSMAGLEEWSLSHNGAIVYNGGVAFNSTEVYNGVIAFTMVQKFAIVKYLVMLQLYSSLSHNGSQVAVKQLDNWQAGRPTRGGRGVS